MSPGKGARGSLFGLLARYILLFTLTLLALVNVWKSSVTTAIGFTVFVLCSLAVLLYHIGPGWLILGGLLFGLASCLFNTRDILRAEAHRPQS